MDTRYSLDYRVIPIGSVSEFAERVYSLKGRIVSIIPYYQQTGDRREVWYEIPNNVEEDTNTSEQHPWQSFLDARKRAILWMREQGYSDAQIALSLSCDEVQVRSTATTEETHTK